jgi:ABC-type transport system substrate-binding protein
MSRKKLSRREFFHTTGIAAGAVLISACTPQVVTQVVRETALVRETSVVEREVIREVEITATPSPDITTPQGRVLPPDAAPLEKQIYYGIDTEPKFLDTARDIYSAGSATNHGNEPMLRNNENIETVPALAESWNLAPKPSIGISSSVKAQCGVMAFRSRPKM